MTWMCMWRRELIGAATVATCAALAACAEGPIRLDPINRVAILLDTSGTFAARVPDAVAKASALLEEMATPALRRWDPGADRISIVTIDASPDVVWEGTLRDLKALDAKTWTDRVTGRRDLSACTDVSAAFRLAADRLAAGDAPTGGKFVWVFSDLIAEPPMSSARACKPVRHPSQPPDDFPWDAFQDAGVEVFWIPADQKLVWRRAAEARHLAGFAFHTVDESASVRISAPPRPVVELTTQEREEAAATLKAGLWTALKWTTVAAGVIVFSVGILIVVVRAASRRHRRGREARPRNPAHVVATRRHGSPFGA